MRQVALIVAVLIQEHLVDNFHWVLLETLSLYAALTVDSVLGMILKGDKIYAFM